MKATTEKNKYIRQRKQNKKTQINNKRTTAAYRRVCYHDREFVRAVIRGKSRNLRRGRFPCSLPFPSFPLSLLSPASRKSRPLNRPGVWKDKFGDGAAIILYRCQISWVPWVTASVLRPKGEGAEPARPSSKSANGNKGSTFYKKVLLSDNVIPWSTLSGRFFVADLTNVRCLHFLTVVLSPTKFDRCFVVHSLFQLLV